MEVSTDLVIKKPKRLTSIVWNHFERIRKADTCYAVCIHCNKKLSGSSNSGTTHLRNHLVRCLKRSNYDVSQLLAVGRKKKDPHTTPNANYEGTPAQDDYSKPSIVKYEPGQRKDQYFSLSSRRFSQERSELDLARMIIMHGYPLSMVEDFAFKVFVKSLQPLFEIAPRSTIELLCLEIYAKEKERMYEVMNGLRGRITLSVETCVSPQCATHYSIVAHYIDDDWKLHKRLLNFVTPQIEDHLSEFIVKCILEWDMESKLFSVTFDDCSTSDDVISQLKDGILHHRTNSCMNHVYDIRSATHVLNLIVQDCIESLKDVVQKIRESFRYIKSSHEKQEKFNEIAHQVGFDTVGILSVDFPGQWNSTYLMLETALEYRGVLCVMPEHDTSFTLALTDNEWELTYMVTGYLKLFVEIMSAIFSNKYPTANIYFPEICDVHIQLIEWCKNHDTFLSSLAASMKAKFDSYWSKCSMALAMAAIVDPRFKMKLVEYYYSQIYGSTALDRIKAILESVKQLYYSYSVCAVNPDSGSGFPGSDSNEDGIDSKDRFKGFDRFLHETSQCQSGVSDLEKYLEEPVFPRTSDFNILNWWKVHTPRYPVLAMMARDILCIPMSTVAPESAFSTGPRALDGYLSSLCPDVRQALICARDWLKVETHENNPSSALAICFQSN